MKRDETAMRHYRATFVEYARKLETLQHLVDSGSAEDSRIEKAIDDVETSRQAHNAARDFLAAELGAGHEEQLTLTACGR